jgi:hypothetical protein
VALTWWLAAQQIGDLFDQSPVAGLISAICIAMEMAAVWLLFVGAGAGWYGAGGD